MSDRTRVRPGVPHQRTRPAWARPDPIDVLAQELDASVAGAVHPDEIAALLESDGLSDDQIRERYGVPDSFALAEQLYDRVPRRHPEPDGPPPDPWRVSLLACLLRGLVFALPGFAYVLGAPLLAGPSGTRTLLAGALCGWAWNQGLAHRAYSWLSLADPTAARHCLLLGTPAGMLLGTALAFAATDPGHPASVAFAAGQSCYLGASSALLVLGRERVLLMALAPMTVGALAASAHPLPMYARLLLLLTSLTAVAVLGLLEVAPAASAPKGRGAVSDMRLPPRWGSPRVRAKPRIWGSEQPQRRRSRTAAKGPRLISSLPYALFGLTTGALVVYATLTDPPAEAQRSALALTLSMGPAEYLLYRFRSGALAALRGSGTSRAFRRATARILARCLVGYLAALLTLALATTTAHPAGLLALGVVLWTGLLLQSFGAVLGATAVCGAAALAQTLALLTHTGRPHTVALAVSAMAALAQSALVCGLLGKATAHR
ncbi:hypothetical protein [Streptomyces camelliae]|uniref:Integral membrane protein n=1 Tax=Streptomyces camelliae TaxID=3004093 RepID=A0ABY7PB50_9ACTN|nr:hypothetical protein [Streptomyces sp. HUAS 2-6]WBO66790.1 hypothetical protein O1G22_30310 [Streptomyces sp. HUAS 2-6]